MASVERRMTALLLTAIASLTSGIGGVIVVLLTRSSSDPRVVKPLIVGRMISFACGVMLFLSFTDLLTNASNAIGATPATLSFFTGMITFTAILSFIPDVDLLESFGFDINHTVCVDEGDCQPRQSPATNISPISTPRASVSNQPKIRNRTINSELSKRNSSAGINDTHPPNQQNSIINYVEISSNQTQTDASTIHHPSIKTHTSSSPPSLLVAGIVSAIAISLHNIPEGISVYLACLKGDKTGILFVIAMTLHNIPEGLAIAAPIYASTGDAYSAIKWSSLSGLFELVGAILFDTLLTASLTPHIIEHCLAAVGGVMVVVCLSELLPSALEGSGGDGNLVTRWCVAGMGVMFICRLLSIWVVDGIV